MPEAAEQKHRRDRQYPALPSAQGLIDIKPEPAVQGDMPSSPEIPDSPGQVRFPEVSGQADPQQPGASHGDFRISRKIVIDLKAEQHACQENRHAVRIPQRKQVVHNRPHKIRKADLPEKAAQQQAQPRGQVLRIPSLFRLQLRHQVPGPLDRPRHQLREERHKQRKAQKVLLRASLAPVNIQHAGNRLEGIKGNAHGQNDAGEPVQRSGSGPSRQPGKGRGGKI